MSEETIWDRLGEAVDNQRSRRRGNVTMPQRLIVGANGKWEIYTGLGLVTERGTLIKDENGQVLDAYDLDNDPQILYSSLSPAARNLLLDKLYKGGFFVSGKPGNVYDEQKAIYNAMFTANSFGLEINNMVNTRLAGMPLVSGGSGYGRRVTSSEDIKVVAQKVAQQTIGRELSDAQINQFIASYQQIERTGGQGGEQAPDITTAAQKFTREQLPSEANAYDYLTYMNKLFSALSAGAQG